MALKMAFAFLAVMLAASTVQTASIGGGTAGAGEGFSDQTKQGLNQIYDLIQAVVAEIRTNGSGLAEDSKNNTWKNLDILEDMWRSTDPQEHAKMPQQMLVVAAAAKEYAAEVRKEAETLSPEAKAGAESLATKLEQLAAALQVGSKVLTDVIKAQQQAQQQATTVETTYPPTQTLPPTTEPPPPGTDQPASKQPATGGLPGLAGKVISAINKILNIRA